MNLHIYKSELNSREFEYSQHYHPKAIIIGLVY